MIRLENYAKKVEVRAGYNWYRWKVFVAEDDSTLDSIKEVVYLLHPTFSNPRRVIKDPATGFALESAGWGSFDMTVTVVFKDNRKEMLTYFLDLSKTWPD
jgi:transcription initiation factor IIF auxiliary subunit